MNILTTKKLTHPEWASNRVSKCKRWMKSRLSVNQIESYQYKLTIQQTLHKGHTSPHYCGPRMSYQPRPSKCQ